MTPKRTSALLLFCVLALLCNAQACKTYPGYSWAATFDHNNDDLVVASNTDAAWNLCNTLKDCWAFNTDAVLKGRRGGITLDKKVLIEDPCDGIYVKS